MITSIHQPSYLPWIGLLDKINKSDTFILLDTVQLSTSTYQNKNIFLDNQGNTHLLTIPINKKNFLNKRINELEITSNLWQKKHDKFLYFNYKKHPYFDEIYPIIEKLYKKRYDFLIDFLIDSLEISFKLFNINTHMIKASELNIDMKLKKEDLILDILKKSNTDKYLSGQGAKVYQKRKNFEKEKIILDYQEFVHPVYRQHNNKEFINGLSCLDAAFNLGSKNTSTLLGTNK